VGSGGKPRIGRGQQRCGNKKGDHPDALLE
jgi:hypothetical protein